MASLLAASPQTAVSKLFSKRAREEPAAISRKRPPKTAEKAAAIVESTPSPTVEDPVVKNNTADSKAGPNVSATEDEKLARTVFVGNLPADVKSKAVKRHFATFGEVESLRLRSAAAANPKMSQRAAVITGEVSGDTMHAYVVFRQNTSVARAVATTGNLAFGRHLRIDCAARPGESSAAVSQHDSRKSVFLGNLPFDIADETLWTIFGGCGQIQYVRVIREPKTQQGKGFGYIGFVEAGSVERALALHGTRIATAPTEDGKPTGGRDVRVLRCSKGKSLARFEQQTTANVAMGKSSKAKAAAMPERGHDDGLSSGAANGTAEDATGASRPRLGWIDRERRRMAKKMAGRAAKIAAKGGSTSGDVRVAAGRAPGGFAPSKKAASKPGKTIVKSGLTAKARREAKERAMAKRERSKLANGKKGAMARAKGPAGGKGKGRKRG